LRPGKGGGYSSASWSSDEETFWPDSRISKNNTKEGKEDRRGVQEGQKPRRASAKKRATHLQAKKYDQQHGKEIHKVALSRQNTSLRNRHERATGTDGGSVKVFDTTPMEKGMKGRNIRRRTRRKKEDGKIRVQPGFVCGASKARGEQACLIGQKGKKPVPVPMDN